MARLIVSMNVSLDGYISAQGQDDGSWLRIDEEVHRAFNELAASAGAFLYGRKVYDEMIPYWPDAIDDPAKPAYEREYGRLWVERPKVVFSTSLRETRWNTRVVQTGALEEVARLKREPDQYLLCYGGSQLVSALQQPASSTNTPCSSTPVRSEAACRSSDSGWTSRSSTFGGSRTESWHSATRRCRLADERTRSFRAAGEMMVIREARWLSAGAPARGSAAHVAPRSILLPFGRLGSTIGGVRDKRGAVDALITLEETFP